MTAEGPLLVVTAGDAKIDNHKYKETFGCKAKMLTPEEAVERIGHAVGGVCPFAVKPGVKTCLDVSLQRFTTVFPACGSSNSAIELTCEELYENFPRRWLGWMCARAGKMLNKNIKRPVTACAAAGRFLLFNIQFWGNINLIRDIFAVFLALAYTLSQQIFDLPIN